MRAWTITTVDDPDERDDFIAAWDEVDREAVEVLRAALGGHQGRPPPTAELASAAARIRKEMRADRYPLSWVRSAAALERGSLPDDGAELMLRCASATISPREQTELEIEKEAALLSLEHADWLAAVIVTVRERAGHEASAEALADAISHCPEVPLEAELDIDDELHLEAAFSTAALAWAALGLIDRDECLTPLGHGPCRERLHVPGAASSIRRPRDERPPGAGDPRNHARSASR